MHFSLSEDTWPGYTETGGIRSMLMICYNKCGTCRKAKKWLEEHGISFTERDIKTANPTAAELKKWQKQSGVEWRKFFNTSGRLYKENNIKDRLKEMSEKEIIELLASDGMMVKRPILITGDKVLIGFKENEYETLLNQ